VREWAASGGGGTGLDVLLWGIVSEAVLAREASPSLVAFFFLAIKMKSNIVMYTILIEGFVQMQQPETFLGGLDDHQHVESYVT